MPRSSAITANRIFLSVGITFHPLTDAPVMPKSRATALHPPKALISWCHSCGAPNLNPIIRQSL
jgi:hypothetical protein